MRMCALVLAAGLVAGSSIDFLSTWKAPGAAPLDFKGRKVAAVLVTDDQSVRVSAEEALARELTARGSIGVPAYRIIPREELQKKDAARGWFERANVAGLVVLRIVATDTEKVYSSVVWTSGYYGYAWDYWGTSWASVYPIGRAREQKIITVEVLLYDLAKGTPIWAGVTRATDPKNVQAYMKELAVDVGRQLERDGLVRR
jgi:hypothetical protein